MSTRDEILVAVSVALLGGVVVGFCIAFGHSLLSFL